MTDVGPILQALYERRFDDAERLRAQAERLTAFEAAALSARCWRRAPIRTPRRTQASPRCTRRR